MTVKELIEVLSKFDPDLKVLTEGTDCWSLATGAIYDEASDTILITTTGHDEFG